MSDERLNTQIAMIACALGATGFGFWLDSFGAGVWMFVVLLIADIASDRLGRR